MLCPSKTPLHPPVVGPTCTALALLGVSGEVWFPDAVTLLRLQWLVSVRKPPREDP